METGGPPKWERSFITLPGEGLNSNAAKYLLALIHLNRGTNFKIHENTCYVPEIICLYGYKLPLRRYLYRLNFKTQSSRIFQ